MKKIDFNRVLDKNEIEQQLKELFDNEFLLKEELLSATKLYITSIFSSETLNLLNKYSLHDLDKTMILDKYLLLYPDSSAIIPRK